VACGKKAERDEQNSGHPAGKHLGKGLRENGENRQRLASRKGHKEGGKILNSEGKNEERRKSQSKGGKNIL